MLGVLADRRNLGSEYLLAVQVWVLHELCKVLASIDHLVLMTIQHVISLAVLVGLLAPISDIIDSLAVVDIVDDLGVVLSEHYRTFFFGRVEVDGAVQLPRRRPLDLACLVVQFLLLNNDVKDVERAVAFLNQVH